MENARKLKQHDFLERLVGTWTVSSPGDSSHPEWTETVRSLHGIWFVAEGEGDMPGGGRAATVLTLGYDPAKGRYVGTWVGTMMTYLWVYEGDTDTGGNVLTLETTGPDMQAEGKMAKYRETVTFIDDDNRTFSSSAEQPDGSWKTFMTVNYTRQKPGRTP
ncbi:DUF1579 domain-containing protein [Pararhizobium sp.]|uniref:DUF1579 domain-containing protein n=1 Tax=Pararhizobium sp. TaxID=1977563 RepID=UPI002720C238|nr:DUF1579 domain-containing protein [Pararhizobium sp.]MDO9417226.1 DUF1579 domain-containing protein [Pararhizobium sp.]